MNCLAINISASIMILVTFLIRRVIRDKIPHVLFLFLWLAIGMRLFIPFSIESSFSFFNWRVAIEKGIEAMMPQLTDLQLEKELFYDEIETKAVSDQKTPIGIIFWGIGFFCCSCFFMIQYSRAKRDVEHCECLEGCIWMEQFIEEQRLPFRVLLKQNPDIVSPFTWGVFHPVIVFPKDFNFKKQPEGMYALLHECGHIKYLHSLCKIFSVLAVCFYWYNPFVWLLFFYLDRDMEIASDRYALGKLQTDHRAAYAKSLLFAASTKKVPIYYYHYKHHFLKERIEAIMHFKK